MPLDDRVGNRMPFWARPDEAPGTKIDPGPYVGKVKNVNDPMKLGRVAVFIPELGGNDEDNDTSWRKVTYASPFFGYTENKNRTTNSFTTSKHSYGMWMTPPDPGVLVLCIFVNGNPNKGYYFACLPDRTNHYMVPGLSSATNLEKGTVNPALKDEIKELDTAPVVEYNDNTVAAALEGDFLKLPKPVHELQARLLINQGLIKDTIRGTNTSSSQRETPSYVFGISTPGRPLSVDLNRNIVTSRVGGHTFFMDDGSEDGTDKQMRLRTSGGHQIVMHDSGEVIYISHASGKSWLEFSADGKIEVYAQSGINVRTKGDLNLHSNRDINMHAGRNINQYAGIKVEVESQTIQHLATLAYQVQGEKIAIASIANYDLLVGATGTIQCVGDMNLEGSNINMNDENTATVEQLQEFTKITHPDVKPNAAGIWTATEQFESIVTEAPTHEPYSRSNRTGQSNQTPTIQRANAETSTAVSAAPATTTGSSTTTTLPAANKNKVDRGKFRGEPAPWASDKAFISKVQEISTNLKLNYIDMLSCMHLESAATFDPWIRNSLGYTGLIQFGGPAAQAIGTTTDALRMMSRVEQCTYVQKYFEVNKLNKKAPSPRLVDIYLTILWPAAVGKPDDFVIWQGGSREYKANPAFDPGGKAGFVTVAMVAAQIAKHVDIVKQCLANAQAGSTTTAVTDGSGRPVVDGSGNPVTTTTTPSTSSN
jgi:hypothetical protein